MRISAITTYSNKNYMMNKGKLRQKEQPEQNQTSFKGIEGKITGGCLGGLGGAFAASLLLGPLGVAAAGLAMLAAGVGGTALGSKIGDEIEGKDEDKDKDAE